MKVVISLVLMVLCTTWSAAAPAGYEGAMSALAAEEIECGVFWNIVGICFETATGDQSTSKRAMTTRDAMFERATQSTTEAGLLTATIDARHRRSQDSLTAKIAKDC